MSGRFYKRVDNWYVSDFGKKNGVALGVTDLRFVELEQSSLSKIRPSTEYREN